MAHASLTNARGRERATPVVCLLRWEGDRLPTPDRARLTGVVFVLNFGLP